METIKNFRNDLLKRNEVKVVVTADKNPGLVNAVKMIAEQLKTKEENVVVKELKSKFGRDSFLIDAFVYDSKADREKTEPKKKEKKKEGEQPQAAPAAAVATPAAAGGKK
jgi:ribosomal protein S24E